MSKGRSALRSKGGVWDRHWSLVPHVEAHADSYADGVPGFWLQDAVEHICMVSFIRRRLDLHKSER